MTCKADLVESEVWRFQLRFSNKKIAAWNFSRKGAKIVNSLTLRLFVRLFSRLSAHAVSSENSDAEVDCGKLYAKLVRWRENS